MERDVGTTRRSKCPDVLEIRRMFSGCGYFIEADVARHPVECRHPPWSDVRREGERANDIKCFVTPVNATLRALRGTLFTQY